MEYATRIEELLSNRDKFNEVVYTRLGDAVRELAARKDDAELAAAVEREFSGKIPSVLQEGNKAVIFRQVATPNYEFMRFIGVPDASGLSAVFLEYFSDKFTSNNPLKYHLGKMIMDEGIDKKGTRKTRYESVINFNDYDGKKISEVKTVWGQSLVDFHHRLFTAYYPQFKESFHDLSPWLAENGVVPKEYYRNLLGSFIRHGILFENFMIQGKELAFIRDIFLPAFFAAWLKTGKKPLIVELEPTEIEGDKFWCSYPSAFAARIEKMKLGLY